MAETYGHDFITRIQFSKSQTHPRITLYSTDGVFAILTGPVADTFNGGLAKAFEEAEKVRVILDDAKRIGVEHAEKQAEADPED